MHRSSCSRLRGAERLDRAHFLSLLFILSAADSTRRRQEPPRGVEPLRPGSKPGALPLSYGGNFECIGTGGGNRTPMGRSPPASEAGASRLFRHARTWTCTPVADEPLR